MRVPAGLTGGGYPLPSGVPSQEGQIPAKVELFPPFRLHPFSPSRPMVHALFGLRDDAVDGTGS
jgi:hypothetical protein